MSNISISSLALPSKTVSMEVPGYDGFMVDVNYLTKDEILKLRRKCTSKKFGRSSRQLEETVDEKLFTKEYISNSIKGWSGLKVKYLKDLMLTDSAETDSLNEEDEVEYSADNAQALVAASDSFDMWLTTVAGDLENFTKSK